MNTFQLAPCAHIGNIKSDIKDAILDGKIPNEYDSAYNLMLELGSKIGLKAVTSSSN